MATQFSEADTGTARDVFLALMSYKNNPNFSDVTVVAEGSEFKCHRVILAAVSSFFRGMFASGMKEAVEGQITLRSVPEKGFSLLLTSIYSGVYVVTEENLFDVWSTADILGVPFLLDQCKAFFEEKLSENLFDLTFEEMKQIVSSKTLAVSSEDNVIETVIRWVESNNDVCSSPDESFTEEEEDSSSTLVDGTGQSSTPKPTEGDGDLEQPLQQDSSTSPSPLADLLECRRYLLISSSCLVNTLACHPLVKADLRCQDIVDRIWRYQAQPDLHQDWCPPAAVHRDSSDLKNVLITQGPCKLYIMDPPSGQWKQITDYSLTCIESTRKKILNMFYIDSNLYIYRSSGEMLHYTPSSQEWKKVNIEMKSDFLNTDIKSYNSIVISQKVYNIESTAERINVYRVSLQHCMIKSFKPVSVKWQAWGSIRRNGLSFRCVSSVGNTLVIFLIDTETKSFVVTCFDLMRHGYTMTRPLGSATDVVTFRRDREAFAITTNGVFWRIFCEPSTGKVEFIQELQLWDGHVDLKGALLFDTQLVIVGKHCDLGSIAHLSDLSLDGVFSKVTFTSDFPSGSKDVIHAVLPRHLLPQ